jgi:hypothetical protein
MKAALIKSAVALAFAAMAATFAYAGVMIIWEDATVFSFGLGAMTAAFAVIPATLALCVAFSKNT